MGDEETEDSWILGTAAGGIYEMTKIPPFIFRIISVLESILEEKIKTLGDFSHKSFIYRETFDSQIRQHVKAYSERKTFVDTDLVSVLFDKGKKEQDEIMNKLNNELRLDAEDFEKIFGFVKHKTLALPSKIAKLKTEHIRLMI